MIHDAVIAGAGPVGLFLSLELRLAGLSVLVVEKDADPASPFKAAPLGRRGLWAPTLEAFHRRGLLDAMSPPPDMRRTEHWMQAGRRPAGHFAGIPLFEENIDTAGWGYRLPGPAEPSLMIETQALEAVLTARAEAAGVQIRRGLGLEAFDQTDDGVTVQAGGETFEALWLVGCDGARGAVRKSAGIALEGTEPEFTGYSLQVELADPDSLPAGRHHTPNGMYSFAKPGVVAMADFDGGAFHRSAPVTVEHAQAVLRRVSGVDVTITALKVASSWTDRAAQATTYRKGRVLLAGDAAHIHSPLGGQGLNLGLGDAMNLGWKLAAMVRGDAPAGLLDTYEAERHPVGLRVLDWSRAQVAIMRPQRSSRALEAILRDLIDTRDGATYFAERVWNVSLRYDLGEGHPLTGRSAPDFAFADETRLGKLLRNGRGLLLDFDARATLADLASRWPDRIVYAAGEPKERLGLSAVLVRPDGVVAWASEAAPDLDEAAQAAARWFGEPLSP